MLRRVCRWDYRMSLGWGKDIRLKLYVTLLLEKDAVMQRAKRLRMR